MPFRVVFLKGSSEIGSSAQGESLAAAKAYALTHFTLHKIRGGATEVQVRNEEGIPVFRHPPV